MDESQARSRLDAVYAAASSRELETIAAALHPDVEFVNPGYAVDSGTRHGREAFVGAMRNLASAFEFATYTVAEVEVNGDRVLAAIDVAARDRTAVPA